MSDPKDAKLEQRIREAIERVERQRDLARAQQQADHLQGMINSGLYGGGAQAVHAAPNVAMPGLHPLPPAPYSDHQRRMNDMVSTDPQMKETLTALCSLMGYEIQSLVLVPGMDIQPVNGEGIAWRVLSRKWQLYCQWIDTASPSFEAFKIHFAKLSDAIAAKREKLVAEGKPLPSEPVEPESIIQQQMEVLRRYAQQASQQGFGHVVDQKAMQNMALRLAGMPPQQAKPLLGEQQAKAFWGSGC